MGEATPGAELVLYPSVFIAWSYACLSRLLRGALILWIGSPPWEYFWDACISAESDFYCPKPMEDWWGRLSRVPLFVGGWKLSRHFWIASHLDWLLAKWRISLILVQWAHLSFPVTDCRCKSTYKRTNVMHQIISRSGNVWHRCTTVV